MDVTSGAGAECLSGADEFTWFCCWSKSKFGPLLWAFLSVNPSAPSGYPVAYILVQSGQIYYDSTKYITVMSDSNFGHLVWALQYVTRNDIFTWSTSCQKLTSRQKYCHRNSYNISKFIRRSDVSLKLLTFFSIVFQELAHQDIFTRPTSI